jgi:hypothetical protein
MIGKSVPNFWVQRSKSLRQQNWLTPLEHPCCEDEGWFVPSPAHFEELTMHNSSDPGSQQYSLLVKLSTAHMAGGLQANATPLHCRVAFVPLLPAK